MSLYTWITLTFCTMISRSIKSNNLSGPIPPSFGTGNYFTSSNEDLLLWVDPVSKFWFHDFLKQWLNVVAFVVMSRDFQNNSLSLISTNLTNAIKYRPNLFVWYRKLSLHSWSRLCEVYAWLASIPIYPDKFPTTAWKPGSLAITS